MTAVLQLLSFIGDCVLDVARSEYAEIELPAGLSRVKA